MAVRHVFQPDPVAKAVKPAGMVQRLDDEEATAYFSLHSLESAIFDVVLFSQPFAEGKVIARRETIGQWHAIPDNSLNGLTRRAACKIDPEKIRDISLKETRTPSFD